MRSIVNYEPQASNPASFIQCESSFDLVVQEDFSVRHGKSLYSFRNDFDNRDFNYENEAVTRFFFFASRLSSLFS